MISHRAIEGTGEEIAKLLQQHPGDRFQLIYLNEQESGKIERSGPDPATWEEAMRVIHSFKGQFGSLPLDATSTESLYDCRSISTF